MSRRTRKHAIRRIIRTTGFDVVRFRGDLEQLQSRLLSEQSIDQVIDVGANEGQYAQRIRQVGYQGRIDAFEPIQVVFQSLRSNFAGDDALVAHNHAVGATNGEFALNVSANTVSSSILEMSDLHRAADPNSDYVQTVIVPMVRLDSLQWSSTKIWLKVDVQGAELQVLDGADAMLDRVRVLQLELSLDVLYDGAPLAEDVLRRVRGRGFTPVHVAPGFQDPRSGRMLQAEGLFVRD